MEMTELIVPISILVPGILFFILLFCLLTKDVNVELDFLCAELKTGHTPSLTNRKQRNRWCNASQLRLRHSQKQKRKNKDANIHHINTNDGGVTTSSISRRLSIGQCPWRSREKTFKRNWLKEFAYSNNQTARGVHSLGLFKITYFSTPLHK